MIGLYSLFVFLALLTFWGISHLVAVAFGAPNVSSDNEVIVAALNLAKAKKGERLLDLGCGWGKVLAIAEKRGLDAEGVDVSPAAVLWNRLWGRKASWQNLTKTNLYNFDIIFIYLLPALIKKINLKTKKGARIIAIDFPIPHRKPNKSAKIGKYKIYIYTP